MPEKLSAPSTPGGGSVRSVPFSETSATERLPSAAFLLINIALIFFGPSLFGAAIAWDTHIGGYITGALVMAALASTRW